MADSGTLPSPTEKFRWPGLPFFTSPRSFSNFASKPFLEPESAAMSPTSILDSKTFSSFKNPFRPDSPKTPKTLEPAEPNKRNWEKSDPRIGLGLVDSFADGKSDSKIPKPETRMVLFGSQLKIQIPPLPPSVLSPANYPESAPPDIGAGESKSRMKKKFEFLTAREMELSEDYTCVIAHGPNPRTTHIFDDTVIGSFDGVVRCSAFGKGNGSLNERSIFPSESFLSSCHGCGKNLGQGNDIFVYRGERAFCSRECRYQEILMEEEMEKSDSDGCFR